MCVLVQLMIRCDENFGNFGGSWGQLNTPCRSIEWTSLITFERVRKEIRADKRQRGRIAHWPVARGTWTRSGHLEGARKTAAPCGQKGLDPLLASTSKIKRSPRHASDEQRRDRNRLNGQQQLTTPRFAKCKVHVPVLPANSIRRRSVRGKKTVRRLPFRHLSRINQNSNN